MSLSTVAAWIPLIFGLAVIALFAAPLLGWLFFGPKGGSTTIAISGSRPARPRPLIELWAAWFWTCDCCGNDNFVRAITAEITPEEAQAYADRYGMTPEDFLDGEWHTKPEVVKCQYCSAEYLVEQNNELETES